MLDSTNCLTGTDAVGVVGIGVAVEGLQLSTLFPSQSMTEIGSRVALGVIGNGLLARIITVYLNFALLSN